MGWIISGIVAFIAVICGVLPAGMYYSDKKECAYAATNASVETKFVKNHPYSWTCFVKVDGKWIPIEKWRGDSDD